MPAAPPEVGRAQVLAYRVAAQQLDRSVADPLALAVLDLGVQDTPVGSARTAVLARTTTPPVEGTTTLIWSVRGAPHLHRPADLPALAAALWPLSDADATARISTTAIRDGAGLGIAAFTATATALRDTVRAPMAKGAVSTAVSAAVPAPLTHWCRACDAQHISGSVFQQAGLAAGVRLEPGGPPTMLAPVDGWAGVPRAAAGTAALVRTYLRLLGPATPAEVARFLGTRPTEVTGVWPADLVEVRVDGRPAWLPADRLDALRAAPAPHLVRLLPSGDPWLQARDRDLTVPGRARQSAVWRIIASPGALFVDAEVAGTWRARKAGRRLDVTVTPFEPLPAAVRAAVEAEAGHLATARGSGDVRVTVEGP